MKLLTRSDLETEFPNLYGKDWRITSPFDKYYNCIGWASNDKTRFWWPDENNGGYWPEEVSRELTIQAFIELFKLQGYSKCSDPELEEGYEKVAIYAKGKIDPKHAARQLPSGEWSSKLGRNVDIKHPLKGLEGTQYGEVAVIMKRPV